MLIVAIVTPYLGLGASRAVESRERVRFTDVIPAVGGKNLVPNGSFEVGSAGWSSTGLGAGYKNAWAPLISNWGNFESLHGTVEKNGAAKGENFLRIRLGGENTPVFSFDYFYPVNHRELRPLAANLGWIELTPGESYTISLNMRASSGGIRGAFGVQNGDTEKRLSVAGTEIIRRVNLTQEWRRYSHTFVATHPYAFVLAGPDLEQEEDVAVDVDAVQLEKGTRATEFTPRATLEVGLAPTALAGVFTVGEPVALRIAASNDSDRTIYARFSFKVTDYADRPVELTEADLEIGPRGTAEKTVLMPPHWRGFYRIQPLCSSGDISVMPRLLRLAIVPPRSTTETVMGVNHAYPTKNLLALARKAGVSWYRDWSLKWQHIEPEKGEYRWDLADSQVDRVTTQGLSLMAMIPFPSAEWNSTAPNLATIRAHSPSYGGDGQGDDQELLLRARWAWLPGNLNDLNGFVSTVVSRYKKQIQVWEFLNEALYSTYSLPSEQILKTKELEGYKVEDYLEVLGATVPAIRAANPGARIVGGGMVLGGAAHPNDTGEALSFEMLKMGLMDYVDIIAVHDYPGMPLRKGGKIHLPEELVRSMDTLRARAMAHGGSKPIWMTEFSYFGSDDLPRQPFIPIPGLWSEPQLISERQVADYTIRYCTIFLARGGEKIFLQSGCTGSVNHPSTESCMFADGAVRKVFAALAVFTEMLGTRPKFVADRLEAGIYVFAFDTDRKTALVLWDPEGDATLTIPSGVVCLDVMGRELLTPTVRLGASPVYWIAPLGHARRVLDACKLVTDTTQILPFKFPNGTPAAMGLYPTR